MGLFISKASREAHPILGQRIGALPASPVEGGLLHLDETGRAVSGPVWSEGTAQGHAAASEVYETYGDWTAQLSWAWFGNGPPNEGLQGVLGATDLWWIDAGVSDLCFELAHLFCFEP